MSGASTIASENARQPAWHPEEDAVLRASIRGAVPVATMLDLLPGRSARAIQTRAKLLGLPLSLRPNALAGMEGEILKLCGYIRSDSTIAEYMGTQIEALARVRRRLPPVANRSVPGLTDLHGPPIAPRADTAAMAGSRRLRDAMVTHYRALAKRNGVSVEQAMLACLYGPRAADNFTKKGVGHE